MDNDAFKNFTYQNYNELADWIFSLNACEFTIIATAIGIFIAQNLSINQQNSLGNFFEQIGQTMLTIAAQSQTVKHKRKQNSSITPGEDDDGVESQIRKLQDEIVQLRKDALMNDNN